MTPHLRATRFVSGATASAAVLTAAALTRLTALSWTQVAAWTLLASVVTALVALAAVLPGRPPSLAARLAEDGE